VPYGVGVPLTSDDRSRLLELARSTLERVVRGGRTPTLRELGVELSRAMETPRGAFISLYAGRRLRGCRGQMLPSQPLYREVMEQVESTALHDSRFPPVEADELAGLTLSISALTELRPVASYREIELGRHGILLTKGSERAVFLPQVAPSAGWDLETTLTHLAQKAGLPPDGWRKGATFEVFEAEVFGED